MIKKCPYCTTLTDFKGYKIPQICICKNKTKKSKEKTCKISDVYKLLKVRPFSKECIYEADLHDAYCLRIIETLEDM